MFFSLISIFSTGYHSRKALDFFIVFLVLTQYIFEDKFGIPFLYSWSLVAAFSSFRFKHGFVDFQFSLFRCSFPRPPIFAGGGRVGWGRTHILIVMES